MTDIFRTPLLTAREASRHLQMPLSTLNYWLAEGRDGPALVHEVQSEHIGWPRVPFVGVVEAYVLRSLRQLGLTKAVVRQAAEEIRREFDSEYGLADRRIATDGVDVFVRYADGIARARDHQRPIRPVLDEYLRSVTWDEDDGWPLRLRLRQYRETAPVVIDPRFAWGEPFLEATKTPVTSIVQLWRSGEPMDVVATEFDLPRDTVEQICRVAPAA